MKRIDKFRKDYIAYIYEASVNCPDCAHGKFGDNPENYKDFEGNPVSTILFYHELDGIENCYECGKKL